MILYFADRLLNILGQASTTLPGGYVVTDDQRVEDVETGVASFSCRIGFDEFSRAALENMADAGNYLLKSGDDKTEFYTIIDAEIDTKNQDVYIYAEDAGLDLINEIVGDFEAADSYNAEWYINKYLYDSGFAIGINEIPASTVRKLKWEGEESTTARLASIATQFGGYEITYRFDIDGLTIKNRYVDIVKKRGVDAGVTLYLNRDIDKIVTSRSIANLATAFICEGAIPEETEDTESDNTPITFKSENFSYDDGDFFVDGNYLKSRKANEKWSRYLWKNEPNQVAGAEGYIVRPYSYNTESAQTLCSHAIAELKKVCDMEINYEIDLKKLPENVKIGDRINIVDDGGEMYVSTRVLMLEVSEVDNKQKATLGEHIIKRSGIYAKVEALASKFAQSTVSVQNAKKVADRAQGMANDAKGQAAQAILDAAEAIEEAETAQGIANTATASAADATAKALAAEAATKKVEESVSSLETTVENAEKAIEEAKSAASIADEKAEEAKTAAGNAATAAGEAKDAAAASDLLAQSALSKANEASTLADTAKTNADSAITTANAAKLDAEQAKTDVQEWAESELETFRQTISAEYARSTELTETTATLQAQITANANQLQIEHSNIVVIDETANDAKEKAEAAQSAADAAQAKADEAANEAAEAQSAADEAAAAAQTAQNEADAANAAAATAQGVADAAAANLATAKADLETVKGRVDATEEDIAAAEQAVAEAQAAADKANADAATAAGAAQAAQNKADNAFNNAATAQSAADAAAEAASNAQNTADNARGDAATAQSTADAAAATAAAAQSTADTAKTNAATAQAKADEAAAAAALADQAAKDADAKAAQAQSDLDAAETNLANLLQRADATEEEIAAAEQAVEAAQTAANNAAAAAATAQSTADTAKTNAATAQTKADEAKGAADAAQKSADEAKEAADAAQGAVDGLAVRVTTAETDILKNAEQIRLSATRTEVETMLSGYSTTTKMNAAIELMANGITSTVSSTYATKEAAEQASESATTANGRLDSAESIIQQLSNCIATFVRDENGESMMTNTGNGWFFSMKETNENVTGLREALETLRTNAGDTRTAIDILKQALEDHGETLEYVTVTTYEDEPCIVLGESDSDFKLLITNTRIMFMNGSNVPTHINTDGLVTQNIKVECEIIQGGFAMVITDGGGWGLQWKGGGE